MSKAVVLTQYGPPDVLVWRDVPTPVPGPGQVRIRVKAAGVSPMSLLASGALRLRRQRPIPMAGAAEAHRLLESGEGHEKLVLEAP